MNTEDTTARTLLGPMLHEPVPPSNVDVSQLVTAGRRRVRLRRWAGVSGAGALTAVALAAASLAIPPQTPPNVALQPGTASSALPPQAPAFPTACTVALLPVPPGAEGSYVSDGDPSGRYLVGGYGDSALNFRPVLWDNGNAIPIPAPGNNLQGIVVNADGVVAGTSDKLVEGALEHFNWIYRNGNVTLLEPVATDPSAFLTVVDINSRGDVLGASRSKGNFAPRKAGIWKAVGGFHELAHPAGLNDIAASALDEDGTVVGRHMAGEGYSGERTLVWATDGQVTQPAPPTGFGPGGALRLVRGGWAYGSYQQAGKQPHETVGILRHLGTGQHTPVTSLAFVGGINSHGWLAGVVREAGQIPAPAIATEANLLKLSLPAQAVPSSDGVGATYVSDDGKTVAGNVAVSADDLAAARWSCQ